MRAGSCNLTFLLYSSRCLLIFAWPTEQAPRWPILIYWNFSELSIILFILILHGFRKKGHFSSQMIPSQNCGRKILNVGFESCRLALEGTRRNKEIVQFKETVLKYNTYKRCVIFSPQITLICTKIVYEISLVSKKTLRLIIYISAARIAIKYIGSLKLVLLELFTRNLQTELFNRLNFLIAFQGQKPSQTLAIRLYPQYLQIWINSSLFKAPHIS